MQFSRYMAIIQICPDSSRKRKVSGILITTPHLSAQEASLLSLTDILRISAQVCHHGLSQASLQRPCCQPCQLLSELLNGDGEIRTLDPLLARQVLSQLSYTPIRVSYIQLSVYEIPLGLLT